MAPPTATTLRPSLKRKAPGTRHERELWEAGHEVVVGIDEVGRGAWAGPLTLGAVVIPKAKRLTKVRDSKLLTPAEREVMFDRVAEWSECWSVGHASHDECDELGMSAAQRLAAQRAIEGLGIVPDRVLLDGNWDFVGGGWLPPTAVRKIVKGDANCLSIAAASILAKVTRDRLMRAEADEHPWWSFDTNKGYPCPRHKTALAGVGPSAIHRRSWVFMEHLPWPGAQRRIPAHLRPDENQGVLFE
ncbi:MAG: ribonuclease HII [Acidimicrobiales bacterium]|nr:ribonuclease HII [Acidimicrobiales bacterium]